MDPRKTTGKMSSDTHKISYCLWFDQQAEEAADFYTSIFKDSRIEKTNHYGKEGQEIHGKPEGAVMTVQFTLEGQKFYALNGGPHFKINPSISFFVSRETEKEIDYLWEELIKGGQVLMPLQGYPFSDHYGWVQDRYGVSWQLILPRKEVDPRPSLVPSMLFVGDRCGRAEEAIAFYRSVFEHTQLGNLVHYGREQAPNEEDHVMYGDFSIGGQWFVTMDSAHDHDFQFNEAVSFVVNCDTQEEVDHYWEKLSADPSAEQCGWLKDKFGVSWQVAPIILSSMLSDPNAGNTEAVMREMLQMKKLNIATLEKAYKNEL